MAERVNEARGEVALAVGDHEVVIAAEMDRLAAVSSRLKLQSLHELYERLTQGEINAVRAGVELLAVRGNVPGALKVLGSTKGLKHFGACTRAFALALAHHFDEDAPGNVEAAEPPTA